MYFNRALVTVERKLKRYATSILIGGILLTFVALIYMTVCTMTCDEVSAGTVKENVAYDKNKLLWNKHLLSPSKNLSAYLFVLIVTDPHNRAERDTIRKTWLQNKPAGVFVRFVIGTASLEESFKKELDREQFSYKDLLLLPKHKELYTTLTNKLLQAFKWLDKNVDFQYVLKVDDDSYARLDQIVDILKFKPKNRLYWGFFDGRAHIKRLGKWAEKDWFACDRYLPYALGGGYILSSDLVNFVTSNANYLKTFLNEDVSVGSWLAPLDIKRIHDPRFDTEFKSRGCNNAYLVTHKQSIRQMKHLYENIKTTGKLCYQEYKVRNSYNYNWSNLPSLCCFRNDSSVP